MKPMEGKRDTFTVRMLDRASCRRNLNGAVIDTTSEHLRRKYSILRAIEDESGDERGNNFNGTMQTHYNTETMQIGTEGNNVSIITSLSAEIDDLDRKINLLGIQEDKMLNNQDIMPMCNRIYPILADIKFDTAHKNNKNENITRNSNDGVDIYETPKATRRYHKPNLESTRKSMKQELSDKMSSPQIETTISTIQLIDSPPINSEKSPDSIKPIADIPDEVEKFLQNALGEELYNSSVTYTDAHHMTNSHIDASELLSESRTPFHKKIKKLLNRHSILKDDSILSANKNSETFDRTARLYRSLSQRIKKKLRSALTKQKPVADNNIPVAISEFPHGPVNGARGEKIEQLLRQVRIQQSIISQATKALEVCHLNKEFIGSLEEVESQRLLLLAYLRKRVMMEELKNLSSPDQQHAAIKSDCPTNEYAEVRIDNIQLSLRKALHDKPEPGEIHEWFLVAVIEGTNVWATPAVPCPISNLTVDYPDFFCIATKLTPKLKITLEVYVLKLITGIEYHHDEKYHISNIKLENNTCPSPTKFLKKVERPLTPRARHPILLTSSFIPSGYVELFLNDLILVSPWPLSAVPPDSNLLGTIDLKFHSKLHLSIKHQGFLNYGDESGGLAIWNRRWCVLKGHTLLFWNYPREHENKKPPLITIDLINCISEKIGPVNRSLCAKPRTLLIELVRPRNIMDRDSLMVECRQSHTIIRHLLSCDSTRELVDWMSILNHVVSVLREWNINTSYYNTASLSSAPPMVSEL